MYSQYLEYIQYLQSVYSQYVQYAQDLQPVYSQYVQFAQDVQFVQDVVCIMYLLLDGVKCLIEFISLCSLTRKNLRSWGVHCCRVESHHGKAEAHALHIGFELAQSIDL